MWWRYPPTAKGIQLNHCKNPLCANFGIPPKAEPAKGQPALLCELCRESIPMQSNLAVVEELMRLGAYLDPESAPCCLEESCAQYGVSVVEQGVFSNLKRLATLRLQDPK